VGSTGRGGRPREPGLGQRASGGASLFSRERCPMLGARHTKTAAKGGTRQSCPPLHLFQILEGGIREAERGARAGPVRSVGGRGLCVCGGGERRSPPFARDSSASKGPGTARLRRRRLRRWVRHTVWSARPPRPREGTRRSLVAAPAVAQYPGGGRHANLAELGLRWVGGNVREHLGHCLDTHGVLVLQVELEQGQALLPARRALQVRLAQLDLLRATRRDERWGHIIVGRPLPECGRQLGLLV
jgi:hypothetical protein